MAGFCCTMKEESDLSLREHILDYIIVLFVDASGFLWAVAKASHAVLLFCMEQDEVSDLSQVEKIDPIRQANAQKHNHGGQNASGTSNPVKKSTAKNTKSMPCNFYNQDIFTHDKTHKTCGVVYRHLCSACFANDGRSFDHPESLCIYLFGVLRLFQHCTGHIATGSWKGRGNQYIQFVRILYCKLLTNGKQQPAFPLEAVLGIYHSATVAPESLCRNKNRKNG